jgi:hypothetical protein
MTRRAVQMMWILDHLADLDADFRVFYRMSWKQAVADTTGPELMALAWRVSVYQGVMAARHAAWQAEQEATVRRSTGGREVHQVVESTPTALAANMGDLFDIG